MRVNNEIYTNIVRCTDSDGRPVYGISVHKSRVGDKEDDTLLEVAKVRDEHGSDQFTAYWTAQNPVEQQLEPEEDAAINDGLLSDGQGYGLSQTSTDNEYEIMLHSADDPDISTLKDEYSSTVERLDYKEISHVFKRVENAIKDHAWNTPSHAANTDGPYYL